MPVFRLRLASGRTCERRLSTVDRPESVQTVVYERKLERCVLVVAHYPEGEIQLSERRDVVEGWLAALPDVGLLGKAGDRLSVMAERFRIESVFEGRLDRDGIPATIRRANERAITTPKARNESATVSTSTSRSVGATSTPSLSKTTAS
ncbi:hypothetical protein [Natronorubrum halophilum]|uniref:hypothetical protein n=1 Tax=Natronorubrum halophilum TaxID=1702106 RepID=UPI0010C1FCD6|nr:hypothetical protein [Natronorubrum halophilum]